MIVYLWGFPLHFSFSPMFQMTAAAKVGINLNYLLCREPLEFFKEKLLDYDCIGANITAPYKEKALTLVDELTENALNSGAVNTIYKKDGKLYGDNTDGEGLCMWLEQSGFMEKSISLLGNGGAARGIAWSLFKRGISVTIYGRHEKGWESLFGSFKNISSFSEKEITINCITEKIVGERILNINYSESNLSSSAGGMLAYQGYYSFLRWFNKNVEPDFFIKTLFECYNSINILPFLKK